MDAIGLWSVLRGSSKTNDFTSYFRKLCFVSVAGFLMTLQAAGQSVVTGDAVGTVTDPSGAIVSHATVILTSSATAATESVTTGSNGFYRFPLLKPGYYS